VARRGLLRGFRAGRRQFVKQLPRIPLQCWVIFTSEKFYDCFGIGKRGCVDDVLGQSSARDKFVDGASETDCIRKQSHCAATMGTRTNIYDAAFNRSGVTGVDNPEEELVRHVANDPGHANCARYSVHGATPSVYRLPDSARMLPRHLYGTQH
jgi:hypothetical protein